MKQTRYFKWKYFILAILFSGFFLYAYIFHSAGFQVDNIDFQSTTQTNSPEPLSSKGTIVKMSKINLKHVVVHVDLKRTPLRLSYLTRLLALLRRLGVTGLLMEYEDMFPYEGELLQLRNPNYYTEDELKLFLKKCKKLHLEVIPLVQTFGHLQFVLQLPQFLHLREQEMYLDSICPSNPESLRLIKNILLQMIYFHANVTPLKHIHIGCNEVWHMNLCDECKKRNLNKSKIFIDHVSTVSSIVKHISRTTKVLIWDDMLRSPPSRRIPVEPVKWYFGSNVSEYLLGKFKYRKAFPNIWIAPAFKGADGSDNVLPNVKNRFLNTFSWLNLTHDYKFKGETKVFKFTGLILTGWSRYEYPRPIIDTLPSSIPSLILNLLVVSKFRSGYLPEYAEEPLNFYTKHIHRNFLKTLGCNLVFLELNDSKIIFEIDNLFLGYCKFNEWNMYNSIKEYIDLHYYLQYVLYNQNFTLDDETCDKFSGKMYESNLTLYDVLSKYYAADFVTEYVSHLMSTIYDLLIITCSS